MKRVLAIFKQDSMIKEILFNGPRHMTLIKTNQRRIHQEGWYPDQKSMCAWLQEFAYSQGIRLDPYQPAAGGYILDEGQYRWYATLPSISPSGPILSVRRQHFHEIPFDSLFPELRSLLSRDALQKNPTIIYGATGSGKTTCLLHLLRQLPGERLMVIDSQLEFRLTDPNHIAFTARPSDSEGRGEYALVQLLRDILRLSPDRIICAEIRYDEVVVFFQSLLSGHRPPLCTLHAGKVSEIKDRLLVLAVANGLPSEIVKNSLQRKFNLIEMNANPKPHVARVYEGCLGNL